MGIEVNGIMPYRKRDDIIRRSIAGESLLVPVRGNLADLQRIFVLDEVSEFIWERLDGVRSTEEIQEEVLSHFEVERGEVETDLRAFLEDLLEHRLIEETAHGV